MRGNEGSPIAARRAPVDRMVAELGLEAAGGKTGVAALLYTYRCTISCRHCLFCCSPANPGVRMDADAALRHLDSLHRLNRVVHIAGGECMLYWPELLSLLKRAKDRRLQPHFIETNCSFAADEKIAAERLAALKFLGLAGIYLSADPFHQEFVPAERFLRVRRLADATFGRENVWCPRDSDEAIREMAQIAADPGRLREYVRTHPPSLVGNAHRELRAHFSPDSAAAGESAIGCVREFSERIWEIHIDPYGNLQTNCGVILGSADEISPGEVLRRGPEKANFAAGLLANGGPAALAEFARERHGFEIPSSFVSKCDLCFGTRLFLRPFYPAVFGPAEAYGYAADEKSVN